MPLFVDQLYRRILNSRVYLRLATLGSFRGLPLTEGEQNAWVLPEGRAAGSKHLPRGATEPVAVLEGWRFAGVVGAP